MSGDWLEILRAEAGKTTLYELGGRLGYSKTAISQVLNGRYPSSTRRIAEKVMMILGGVECPLTNQREPSEKCQEMRNKPMPASSPEALRKWTLCQHKCPNNKETKS